MPTLVMIIALIFVIGTDILFIVGLFLAIRCMIRFLKTNRNKR